MEQPGGEFEGLRILLQRDFPHGGRNKRHSALASNQPLDLRRAAALERKDT